jgi:hypothetical protein
MMSVVEKWTTYNNAKGSGRPAVGTGTENAMACESHAPGVWLDRWDR